MESTKLRQRRLLQRQACRATLGALCLLVSAVGEAVTQEQTTLPGGASSLQETYQDWLVACVHKDVKRCAVSQQQAQQNGQRLLAIELTASTDAETATGTLVLPFGLALEAGVILQVDDNPAATPLRFSTCLSAGCIVPLKFDAPTLAALRVGTTLKAMAKAANSDQPGTLSISLKGFSAAFDRAAVLMK
jgi:invasion protein IalB